MKIVEFKPTYVKENGVVVVYGKSIPFPKNFRPLVFESGSVVIPPKQFGGNHKHPRIEVFYTTGDLTILWIDKNGSKHKVSMKPVDGVYKLFTTEPYEPHTVINDSKYTQILVEYADHEQGDVEQVNLLT